MTSCSDEPQKGSGRRSSWCISDTSRSSIGLLRQSVAVPFRVNPDLGGARIVTGRDFVFWTGPLVDMVGHGTHVAGTILQERTTASAWLGLPIARA